MNKAFIFDDGAIKGAVSQFPTPFHLYSEEGIRTKAREMKAAYQWVPAERNGAIKEGYKNFFAVKALPNPYILSMVKEEGMGFDCSSMAELLMCEKMGYSGDELFFTSNNTKLEEFQKAAQLGAVINLDDYTHIDYLFENGIKPDTLCFRFNPGSERTGNVLIGNPADAKYGFTREQLFDGYKKAQAAGVKRFGLHTMVASNELENSYFVETARMLFQLAIEIEKETGVQVDFVNLGGGVGIPYTPEQKEVDIQWVSSEIHKLYQEMIVPAGLDPLRIVSENGRVVTGPYGALITKAIHHKDIYKKYIGVDACMADLMRPGMYGAYHHISVLGKGDKGPRTYDVVGSLCENNDKFAIDRSLPEIDEGDILAIHDSGAHGYSMGFNYNGKLRSAEILLRQDGSYQMIRRAETYDDYFRTLDVVDWNGIGQ